MTRKTGRKTFISGRLGLRTNFQYVTYYMWQLSKPQLISPGVFSIYREIHSRHELVTSHLKVSRVVSRSMSIRRTIQQSVYFKSRISSTVDSPATNALIQLLSKMISTLGHHGTYNSSLKGSLTITYCLN